MQEYLRPHTFGTSTLEALAIRSARMALAYGMLTTILMAMWIQPYPSQISLPLEDGVSQV